VFSFAWFGQGLDRLSEKLPCPCSPDVSDEDKKELCVAIEGFGELYERLSNGPLDLARLDPADLRSREAAPPRQPPHREALAHARLFCQLGQRLSLVLHRDTSLANCVPSVKCWCLPPMRSVSVTSRNTSLDAPVQAKCFRCHPLGSRACGDNALDEEKVV
jgi:hypothetical protein